MEYCCFALAVFGCLAIHPLTGQSPDAPREAALAKSEYRIKLELTISDDSLKNRVSSLLGRELRALGDVITVDEQPMYVIKVVGMETYTKTKEYAGPVLAVFLGQSYDLSPVLEFVNATDKPAPETLMRQQAIWALFNFPQVGSVYLRELLYTGPDLERTAKDVVAELDSRILEPDRKRRQSWRDVWQKFGKPIPPPAAKPKP